MHGPIKNLRTDLFSIESAFNLKIGLLFNKENNTFTLFDTPEG